MNRHNPGPNLTQNIGVTSPEGMYERTKEHDACGLGFVANLKGVKSHKIVENGIKILENLEHRGATGADPLVGDGAGMLIQIPHDFFRSECEKLTIELPNSGQYGVGFFFMPQDKVLKSKIVKVIEKVSADELGGVIGWRKVPSNNGCLSRNENILKAEPDHLQAFIGMSSKVSEEEFERKLFILRKVISNAVIEAFGEVEEFYPVSISCRTIVYKGMFLADQLAKYYPDLTDARVTSALALVHQRFSTNTFPSWKLAHPYRMVSHNGEINTLRGNYNWMAARQASLSSPLFGKDIGKIWPISYEGQSDTACFDNALELLVRGGYSISHAMMMLIPEAWAGNPLMDNKRRAFYEYHAAMMEPWDGPAALAFTDGRQIGATLDRNGLRPARYFVLDDDTVVLASEAGTLAVDESRVITKWRLQPGKMLLIDLIEGKIISDDEIKKKLAENNPYQEWLDNTQIILEELESSGLSSRRFQESDLRNGQKVFGYTQEDIKLLMSPMAVTGQEAIGSMGTDTPISAISEKPRTTRRLGPGEHAPKKHMVARYTHSSVAI